MLAGLNEDEEVHGGDYVNDDLRRLAVEDANHGRTLAKGTLATSSMQTLSPHAMIHVDQDDADDAAQQATLRKQFARDQKEILKRIAQIPLPFGSLNEAFCYLVFVLLFLMTTCVVEHNTNAFYFSDRVQDALLQQHFVSQGLDQTQVQDPPLPTRLKAFEQIQTQGDVLFFLQGPLSQVVYETTDYNGVPLNSQESGMVLSYNRLVGGIRLRNIRVKPDSCPRLDEIPEYSSLVTFCYGSYVDAQEQTKGFGPILNAAIVISSVAFNFAQNFFNSLLSAKSYDDLKTCYTSCPTSCEDSFGLESFRYRSQCSSFCQIHCKCLYEEPEGFHLCANPAPDGTPAPVYSFNWSTAAETQDLRIAGTVANYPASGYVVDLPLNGTMARSMLSQLKSGRFLDLATRALVVDLTLFNAYSKLFNLIQFVFEFPATGGTIVNFSEMVLPLYRYSHDNTPRVVLEGLLVASVLIRTLLLLKRLLLDRRDIRTLWKYLKTNAWVCLEIVQIGIFWAVVVFRLMLIDYVYGTLSGQAKLQVGSLNEIPHFQKFAKWTHAESQLNSLNTLAIWLFAFKYLQMVHRLYFFLKMLKRALVDLLCFACLVVLIVVAFAQVGFLLFGIEVASFETLGKSIVTMLQALSSASALDFQQLYLSSQIVGPVFYLVFYLLMVLILLNVFMAILNDAYIQTMMEEQADQLDDFELDGNTSTNASERRAMRKLSNFERKALQLHMYPFSQGVWIGILRWRLELQQLFSRNKTQNPQSASVSAVESFSNDEEAKRLGRSRKWLRHMKSKLHQDSDQPLPLPKNVNSEHDSQSSTNDKVDETREGGGVNSQRKRKLSTTSQLLTERLESLLESNKTKATQLNDMHQALESIESMCRQLTQQSKKLSNTSLLGGSKSRSQLAGSYNSSMDPTVAAAAVAATEEIEEVSL